MTPKQLTQLEKQKEDRQIVKVCKVCGKGFVTTREAQVVCSIVCRNRLNRRSTNKPRNYGVKQCEQCGQDYIQRSTQQHYCSVACNRRASYYRNIEHKRAYDRHRVRRTTIGLNIRNVHLNLEKPQAKWVWDGRGRWSMKYPDLTDCLECNSHIFRHMGNGVCCYCWDKLRVKDAEKLKQLKKEWYERVKGTRPKYRKIADEWIGKAEHQEIPITPPIENLLENLHQLEQPAIPKQ